MTKFNESKIEQLKELRDKDFSIAQIAKELGVSKSTVSYQMKKLGMNGDKSVCKLNKRTEGELKRLRAEGFGAKLIAREMNVAVSTVKRWLETLGMPGQLDTYQKTQKEITCQQCGKACVMESKAAKFCSDICRHRYNKANRGHERKCEVCNETFFDYREMKYCSVNCKQSKIKERKQERERERKQILSVEKAKRERTKALKRLAKTLNKVNNSRRTCECCGKEYFKGKESNANKFCGEECKERIQKEKAKQYRKVNKRPNKDRRWTKNGKADYSICLSKLFERDNGKCHICGGQTDYDDFIRDANEHFIAGNNYPSIDHVIAIANGGLHQWDNVKLAHRICNSIKHTKEI